MKNNTNILISGSIVFDRIMDFPGYFKDNIMPDKLHILNVSFVINDVKESFGGTAGNIAYNLSMLNEKPKIFTTVGKDFPLYQNWLKKNKIDTFGLKLIKDKLTASVYIITDKSDNQISAFNPGAMATARGRFSLDLKNNNLAIISPGNTTDMVGYAELYKRQKIKYIFDPGQQTTSLTPEELKNCITGAEILIGNDYEIELIGRKVKWTVSQIIDKVKILIITKGEKGSEIYYEGKKSLIKAIKIKKALDPTGAGDAYRAGLIKGLVRGWTIEKSAKLASTVAGYAVENFGTQTYRFSQKDLEKRFFENYKEKLN